MKHISAVLALLLVASLFSASFALAEDSAMPYPVLNSKGKSPATTMMGGSGGGNEGPEASVDAVEATKGDIQSVDIENSLADLETLGNDYKQVGFPLFRSFAGALKDSKDGYLAHVGLVEVKLLASDGTRLDIALGRLKIADHKYKLVATKLNTQVFLLYVLPSDAKITSLKDVSEQSIGTLTFSTRQQYGKLHMYAGALTLKKGDFVGTWNGDFWSDSKTLRKTVTPGKAAVATKVTTDSEQPTTDKAIEESSVKTVPAQKASSFARFWSRFFGKAEVKTAVAAQAS